MRWGSGWEGRRALLREKAAHGKALGLEGEGYSWNAESEDELALRCSQRSRQAKSHAEPCPIISQSCSQDLNLGLRSTL